MGRVEGKIALITGAGIGIGFEMAKLFAAEGAHVYIADMNEGSAHDAAKTITDTGGRATAITADITQKDDINNMLKVVEHGHGKLHILVNNAGISGRKDFRNMDDATWDQIMDVNLTGTMRCMRDAFKLLSASGNASIINLSSVMATKHTRQMSNYSTTKGAVSALSRSVALEYARYNIRVNYLCPGWIETKMTNRFTSNPFIAKALLQQTPLNRFGTAEEVAKAALFLASDDAAFITGTGLNVDGGISVSL